MDAKILQPRQFRELLDIEGQLDLADFLRRGNIEAAEEFLLVVIDHHWVNGHLSSAEAAEYYNLLNLSPERAAQFRQRNVGIIYA